MWKFSFGQQSDLVERFWENDENQRTHIGGNALEVT